MLGGFHPWLHMGVAWGVVKTSDAQAPLQAKWGGTQALIFFFLRPPRDFSAHPEKRTTVLAFNRMLETLAT